MAIKIKDKNRGTLMRIVILGAFRDELTSITRNFLNLKYSIINDMMKLIALFNSKVLMHFLPIRNKRINRSQAY